MDIYTDGRRFESALNLNSFIDNFTILFNSGLKTPDSNPLNNSKVPVQYKTHVTVLLVMPSRPLLFVCYTQSKWASIFPKKSRTTFFLFSIQIFFYGAIRPHSVGVTSVCGGGGRALNRGMPKYYIYNKFNTPGCFHFQF